MSVVNEQAMVRITFDDILQNLRAYLQRVESGEAFVILKAGTPVAEIKPVAHTSKRLRPYGLCKGAFIVPDDFDAPLLEETLTGFEQ